MNPYFFVPATKLNKLNYISGLGLENIIIDFEDAIPKKINKYTLLTNLANVSEFARYWLRVPCRENFDEIVNFDFLKKMIDSGFRKFVIPKLISVEEGKRLLQILPDDKNIQIIILVEHPRFVYECYELLKSDSKNNIVGVGLGAEDFFTFLNIDKTSFQLDLLRSQVVWLAKGFGRLAIDIVSLNIQKEEAFRREVENAIASGYDGKFLINPKQYTWMQNNVSYINDRINWAKMILNALPQEIDIDNIEPFVIEGKIIEKPHVISALNIMREYGKK